jgi:copper resistance protein C
MAIHRAIMNAGASLALLLAGATVALAHAELTRATPPAGGNVAVAPSEVTVNFSEPLEPAFSTIVVRDSAGKQVDKADAHVDKADRTIMQVSLQPLPRGTYTVKWRAVTVDTHRTEGAFIFRVGE